jgi:glycosyltransferase involved in cell wall biosynthesis
VSVCILVYNHENYIEQCLENIVTQVCDFNFEVIVGDDCSADGSVNIIKKYADKYPDIIKPIYHKINQGGARNYLSVHSLAKGKYIAHIDGDDYPLPGKLQAQADFMDKTHDCNICFHRVQGLYLDGSLKDDLINYKNIKDGFERKDFLMYMAVGAHSSKMYRRELRDVNMPGFGGLDWYINIEQVKDKKAYFVNDKIYGVYRIGVGTSTHDKIRIKSLIIKTLNYVLIHYPKDKIYINSMYLVLFLTDLKNRRDFRAYFYGWIKTFTFKGIIITIKTWKIRRMFRVG